jgi:hypothetical protein
MVLLSTSSNVTPRNTRERCTCISALIAQITRPVRFHVPDILGASVAADNGPIDAVPKPWPQIKAARRRHRPAWL